MERARRHRCGREERSRRESAPATSPRSAVLVLGSARWANLPDADEFQDRDDHDDDTDNIEDAVIHERESNEEVTLAAWM